MPNKKHLLTKSAFVNAIDCARFFSVYQNERERLQAPDEAQQALFDQGHDIGEMAKMLYPDGIEIDWNDGHEAGIAQTAEVIGKRRPIFEAGFRHGRTHARADILNPSSNGRWDFIEVKRSTEVKEEYLDDVAFQKHACNAGFEIRVLRSCANHFPKYAAWCESLLPRFADLLLPFREFHYYHPGQEGSASLKAVLPAMTGKGYDRLEISDGQTAGSGSAKWHSAMWRHRGRRQSAGRWKPTVTWTPRA